MVASERGLRRLSLAGPQDVLPEFTGTPLREGTGVATEAAAQLREYFARKRRCFEVPIDWSHLEGFRLHVLRTLYDEVPYGHTTSYRGLAEMSGRPDAARAVGTIMGSNPIALVVPCHRVLASGGGLGGYGSGLPVKRRILVLEGILEPSLLEMDMIPE